MKAYVVSPSASGSGSHERFLKIIEHEHVAIIGYANENGRANAFYSIKDGDLIIIARGANWNKQCYFAGIADGNDWFVRNVEGEPYPEKYARKLRGFVDLRREKVPFNMECKGGESANPHRTCSRIGGSPADDAVIRFVKTLVDKALLQEVNMKYVELLKLSKNLILTGAPGTGKTYLARQIARSMVLNEAEKKLPQNEIDKLIEERTSFVQFHPSYDYTDFVEGLRPVRVGEDTLHIGFERKDGIFKALCRRAVGNAEVGRVDNFDEAWSNLIALLNDKGRLSVPLISGRGGFPVALNEYGNGLASRTYDEAGKDWIRGQSKFFTKDQLYNVYLGKTGVPSGGHDNYRKAIVEFMCNHCQLKPFHAGASVMVARQQPYVMIIDEINRGDISKIFGELFYAIDKGYRGKSGSVKTQYQNLVDENDPFFNGFYVPENVYVIGTMNDIDRNVESMDFAIRRRFAWEEIKPEERFDAVMSGLKDSTETSVPEDIIKQANDRMDGLNSAICDKKHGLGSAYQIGPSYFMKIADYTGDANMRFEALWTHHLKPLLMEYLRGMPNADDTIKNLKYAYDNSTTGNTESVEEAAGSAG
ncbi:MAG: AAA family ATPase [Kiritimatiellae bacterium]|nr:AAA family ATPase [Kiritimatiellia bacterium]